MANWAKTDARRLRDARHRLGWSRKRLAEEAGLSERTIVDLERCARGDGSPINPRRYTLISVAQAVGDERLAGKLGVDLEAQDPPRDNRRRQTLSYGGKPLTAEEEADILRYIDWVRSRND